jgi:CheY-like chemotaxis protein
MVREFATTLLRRAGYTIIPAVDGVEAVDLFEQNTDAIDLALLDLMMPRMGGREAFERIRAIRPGLPVIVATGFSDDAVHGEFASDVLLLNKPYKAGDLLHGIRNAIARAQ